GRRFFVGSGSGSLSAEKGIEQLNDIYAALLKQGWTMTEIDEMDIYHYLEVLAHENKPKVVPIDQVFF
ncbi:hypothetical protein P9D21_23105, partial [Bacillus licheniformis]|uniref:hypothetical protein n=1 Tax=Bacillus licheniformis TaxID=1402 RepID=UPI002E0259B3|nr:hypothetical protein [Bacillus licheniformis]